MTEIKPRYRKLIHACSLISPKYKHILEFGTASGITVSYISEHAPEDTQIFGFDTFVGLPSPWIDKKGQKILEKGYFSTDGEIPVVRKVKFFKGLFKDTIPNYLLIAQPIALLHIDCDLYESTVDVLYPLSDWIRSGTIIVFDEWYYNYDKFYDDHEQKAFYEWVANLGLKYELVEFDVPETFEQQIIRIL
jgi:predicted O-methyltransferase YrrM